MGTPHAICGPGWAQAGLSLPTSFFLLCSELKKSGHRDRLPVQPMAVVFLPRRDWRYEQSHRFAQKSAKPCELGGTAHTAQKTLISTSPNGRRLKVGLSNPTVLSGRGALGTPAAGQSWGWALRADHQNATCHQGWGGFSGRFWSPKVDSFSAAGRPAALLQPPARPLTRPSSKPLWAPPRAGSARDPTGSWPSCARPCAMHVPQGTRPPVEPTLPPGEALPVAHSAASSDASAQKVPGTVAQKHVARAAVRPPIQHR